MPGYQGSPVTKAEYFAYLPSEWVRDWVSARPEENDAEDSEPNGKEHPQVYGTFVPTEIMLLCDGNATKALLLSQLSYWHKLSRKNKPRIKHWQHRELWVVRQHWEWLTELGIKPDTARKALRELEKEGLIIKKRHFSDLYKNCNDAAERAVMIRINWSVFEPRVIACQQKLAAERNRGKPLTKTAKNAAQETAERAKSKSEKSTAIPAYTENPSENETQTDEQRFTEFSDSVQSTSACQAHACTAESEESKSAGDGTDTMELLISGVKSVICDADSKSAVNCELSNVSGQDDSADLENCDTELNSPSDQNRNQDLTLRNELPDERASAGSEITSHSSDSRTENEKTRASSARDTDVFKEAVAEIWDTKSRVIIDQLMVTLLGKHPLESEYFDCNVTPPVSLEELIEFGQYYNAVYPRGSKPRKPEKVQDWIERSRQREIGFLWYKDHLIEVVPKLPPDYNTSYQAIWAHLNKYYPGECKRIWQIHDVIDEHYKNSEQKMWWCVFRYNGKHAISIVPIECDQPGQYLLDHNPDEVDRISREFGC